MNKNSVLILVFFLLFFQESYAFQKSSVDQESLKIGLLITDETSVEAQNAAQMAIELANKKITKNGKKFELITKSMEGPWGTGSKEAVNMVFNDNVWAILGSHDGRNAHLVEQVIAKTRVVFVSAWASDPTLSQAYVPWFFNVVPNDIQQAKALIDEIYTKKNMAKIAVFSEENYDANLEAESFLKELKAANKPKPIHLTYKTSTQNFDHFIQIVKKENVKGIVLFGNAATSWRVIEQFREKQLSIPIFSTPKLLGSSDLDQKTLTEQRNIFISTSGNWLENKELSFQNNYKKKYGNMPSAIAAYAFDGMNILISAIQSSGYNREKLLAILPKTDQLGATGSIQFDKKGNRLQGTYLIDISSKN
jgi:ABC-type branched-subunit amino acid transport system substrate-binding protein